MTTERTQFFDLNLTPVKPVVRIEHSRAPAADMMARYRVYSARTNILLHDDLTTTQVQRLMAENDWILDPASVVPDHL